MSASSFILAIAFANLLPAEVYGAYQYLLSFSAIIGALTLTGMNHAITQSVARGHEGEMRHAVALQLSWGCVPFFASLAGAGYFLFQGDQSAAIGMIAIGILVPLANAFNTYSAFLSGRKKFKLGFFSLRTPWHFL
jgi:O-antigen/teichoic acid export membrane protein